MLSFAAALEVTLVSHVWTQFYVGIWCCLVLYKATFKGFYSLWYFPELVKICDFLLGSYACLYCMLKYLLCIFSLTQLVYTLSISLSCW